MLRFLTKENLAFALVTIAGLIVVPWFMALVLAVLIVVAGLVLVYVGLLVRRRRQDIRSEAEQIGSDPAPAPQGLDREGFEEFCLREFARLEGTTLEEIENIREQLVVVDDSLSREDIAALFRDSESDAGMPLQRDLNEESPRRLFAILNERLAPSSPYLLQRTLSAPLGADIYLAP